jgi:ATP-dependent RNA helicase RhlE
VPVKTVVAVGGVSINPQMLELRGGADLAVATPGRLLDLVDHNALRLSAVRTLVLDEADRLLSLGFAEELARVRALVPAQCQNLLFSATFPAAVRGLVDQLLRDPVAINIDAGATPDARAIVQRAIAVDERRRTVLLRHLLRTHRWSRVLVFVATKHASEHVSVKLRRTASPRHPCMVSSARARVVRRSSISRPAACRCWWRPISRGEAWTSLNCPSL